ncbi:MAG: hypothetical protein AUG13_02030 [Chloroflexi bacterium 13_1_20CM_2_59_7]|nr:MAG: hypothetical protein AUG13_02030 [Chloroflexi bacterium 13_1_20CM_2_59_7]
MLLKTWRVRQRGAMETRRETYQSLTSGQLGSRGIVMVESLGNMLDFRRRTSEAGRGGQRGGVRVQ